LSHGSSSSEPKNSKKPFGPDARGEVEIVDFGGDGAYSKKPFAPGAKATLIGVDFEALRVSPTESELDTVEIEPDEAVTQR